MAENETVTGIAATCSRCCGRRVICRNNAHGDCSAVKECAHPCPQCEARAAALQKAINEWCEADCNPGIGQDVDAEHYRAVHALRGLYTGTLERVRYCTAPVPLKRASKA